MALAKHFVSTFLCIFVLFFLKNDLVICDAANDDNLGNALNAVERRERDLELQDNEYFGQPENIGYGFQKTLGFFDNNGPASELGSYDSSPKNDNELQNILYNYGNYPKEKEYENGFDKRKSNFRERMSNPRNNYLISEKESNEDVPSAGLEYLRLLKTLWTKYRQSRPDEYNLEDLTDEQLEELLRHLNGKDEEEGYDDGYGNSDQSVYDRLEAIPLRYRKNYRVFERFGDRQKRYPSFGEGFYGKRNPHSQNLNYENLSENPFLYSLKFVNPELNREAVENLRDEGFEMLGDEKDKDIIRILNGAMNRPKYPEGDEPYFLKDQNNYEENDSWLPGPVSFSEGNYGGDLGRNEKRTEPSPRFFKNHNGIHINTKRFPVKRSTTRVRKAAKSEKVSKEVKDIFSTKETTTVPPKKVSTKKPTELIKKQNVTKPEVTKHREIKKVVRRADKYSKEVLPANSNKEIADIFNVKKKSVDWSQYFGIDKRSDWLKNDYLKRAEQHLMAPKTKRLSLDRANVGNVNFLDRSQYQQPFDTRVFNKKRFSYDVDINIDNVENKIGDMEEKIIDDAVKYTGAHSGLTNEDLKKVKYIIIQHLEAAYSLEKMRKALEEFKTLIKPEKVVKNQNVGNQETAKNIPTEASKSEPRTLASRENPNSEKPSSENKANSDTSKRVAIKKEGVFNPELSDTLEFLNDGSESKQFEDDECPVLDQILHNCFRVEEINGRYAEVLVPLCSLQQICYFCGAEIGFSKASMCDAMYLQEAQNICRGDNTCLINARNSMLALQDLFEQDIVNRNGPSLLSGSCLANPCIRRYFLSSPGAIYPLEVQN